MFVYISGILLGWGEGQMKSDSPWFSIFLSIRWRCLDFVQFYMSLMLLASDYTKIIAAGETALCSSGLLQKGWIALFEPAHGWKSAVKVSFAEEVDSNFMYWGNRKNQPHSWTPAFHIYICQSENRELSAADAKQTLSCLLWICFKASFLTWVSIMVIVYNFVASASCNLVQAP